MKIFLKKTEDDKLPKTIEGVNFIKKVEVNPIKSISYFERVARTKGYVEKTILEIETGLIERIDLWRNGSKI